MVKFQIYLVLFSAGRVIVRNMVDPPWHCAVCFERFTDPQLVACGHTFCLRCVQHLPQPTCPTCGTSFTGFASNITLKQLLDTMEAASTQEKIKQEHDEECRRFGAWDPKTGKRKPQDASNEFSASSDCEPSFPAGRKRARLLATPNLAPTPGL